MYHIDVASQVVSTYALYDYSIGSLQTATTRRKAVSTRRIFALLVVLALSLGLCSLPAGSAMLQRHTATDDVSVVGVATYKGGDDGGGIESGDDDRWGNTSPDDPEEESGQPGGDEEGNDEINARVAGGVHLIGFRFLFGYLMALL
jgi:hypothetical protein